MTLIWAHQPTEACRILGNVEPSRRVQAISETGARTEAECRLIVYKRSYFGLPGRNERVYWVINNEWYPQQLRLARVP